VGFGTTRSGRRTDFEGLKEAKEEEGVLNPRCVSKEMNVVSATYPGRCDVAGHGDLFYFVAAE
jgi:hypothetical protein